MSDLVIIAFPDEATAFEARAELMKLQKEYLIEMEDAVVITRSEDGAVRLHQPINLTGAGAVSGTLWGGLVGLIFLNPLLGAAIGAGAGYLTQQERDRQAAAQQQAFNAGVQAGKQQSAQTPKQ